MFFFFFLLFFFFPVPLKDLSQGTRLTRQCNECVIDVVWKTSSAERRAAPAGIIVFHLPNSASENHSDALGGTNDSSAFHFTILAGTVDLIGSGGAALVTVMCAHACAAGDKRGGLTLWACPHIVSSDLPPLQLLWPT